MPNRGLPYDLDHVHMRTAEYEALKASIQHWRERFEKLETTRAMCCWENEKKVKQLTEELEAAKQEIEDLEKDYAELEQEVEDCPYDHH